MQGLIILSLLVILASMIRFGLNLEREVEKLQREIHLLRIERLDREYRHD